MAHDLDTQVQAFRTHPLGESGPFTFAAADALTMKVRENGRGRAAHRPWPRPGDRMRRCGHRRAHRPRPWPAPAMPPDRRQTPGRPARSRAEVPQGPAQTRLRGPSTIDCLIEVVAPPARSTSAIVDAARTAQHAGDDRGRRGDRGDRPRAHPGAGRVHMFGDQRSKTGPLNRFHDRHQARGRHQVGIVELVVHIDPPAKAPALSTRLTCIESNPVEQRGPESRARPLGVAVRSASDRPRRQRRTGHPNLGGTGIQAWAGPVGDLGGRGDDAKVPDPRVGWWPRPRRTTRPGASRAGLAVVVAGRFPVTFPAGSCRRPQSRAQSPARRISCVKNHVGAPLSTSASGLPGVGQSVVNNTPYSVGPPPARFTSTTVPRGPRYRGQLPVAGLRVSSRSMRTTSPTPIALLRVGRRATRATGGAGVVTARCTPLAASTGRRAPRPIRPR